MEITKNYLLGKVVQIYPGDTATKFGKVLEINDSGMLFEITKSGSRDYNVGDIYFISYSANLSVRLVK